MPQWIIWRVIVPALDALIRACFCQSVNPSLCWRFLTPTRKRLPLKTSVNAIEGQIASYAWGNDYHLVISERLQALVAFIEEQVGHPIPNRWYTDTGPILERDLAQRAGLGWIGKNTCLINPRYGSYFLLAEILLGVELEPDPSFQTDQCGTCTRCIEACPTQCILPDRTIDARRCISYLTIELKENVPTESAFFHWQLDFRMRHLPDGLSVESFCRV